ncbi:hypothetical protein BCR35DRAFT_301080 [Leucosporidium creatinivorum]|uniref:Indoleamine 2,3-dioxygenase n=1 Tax=Leucosporidium creatinivorum TaxID=106004 RepID=A0A1Y2FZG6_9BASI|nr:hypothetical protein BCR35DRAFT_301080 [Leucosporidium creatinivorum]
MTILRQAIRQQRRSLASLAHTTPTPRPLLLEDYSPAEQAKLPQFTISRERGFLPRQDPLVDLPKEFAPLDSLLKRMTIRQPDGTQGLLALGQFGDAVNAELKGAGLAEKVDQVIASGNQHLMSALFRDFCFSASAYLLEPVDQHFRATGQYCSGRDVLPAELAVPLNRLADALGHFPFMEYSSSYALQNYQRINKGNETDPQRLGTGWETDNLRLIRAFEDADGSEAGFILVHVTMVAHSGQVVHYTENVLEAANAGDRKAFNVAMRGLLSTYEKINVAMDTMWSWSRPVDYLKFRSFIFGTGPEKANEMFPHGVVYEGVDEEPKTFRGESGANDTLIPMLDNTTQTTARLPRNELTATLREFRAYRPAAQRVYLEALEHRATEANIAEFSKGNKESLALFILLLDQNREFRDRHWRFTKQYILRYTNFPIATGGSPIVKYLPNNLRTVLNFLDEAFTLLPTSTGLPDDLAIKVDAARGRAETQLRVLDREVVQLEGELVKGSHDKRAWNKGMVGSDGVG